MTDLVKSPFGFLYKIYYYYDLLKNLNYKSYEKVKDFNNKMYHRNTLEGYIYYFVDVVKEHILRQFQDIRKIKIVVNTFDENIIEHSFMKFVHEKIYNDILKNNDTLKNINLNKIIDFNKSIFVTVYDEDNKIFFIGVFGYHNVQRNDIEYLEYVKKMRALNSK